MARLRAVVTIQPPGFGGTPVAGHRCDGDDERLLDRLLGDVDVAEEADQGGHGPAGLLPEDPGDLAVSHELGRSVTAAVSPRARPGRAAPRPGRGRPSVALAAHARAASRSAASMTQNPPSCSLVSANGPSVVRTSPSLHRHDGGGVGRVEAAGEHPGALAPAARR